MMAQIEKAAKKDVENNRMQRLMAEEVEKAVKLAEESGTADILREITRLRAEVKLLTQEKQRHHERVSAYESASINEANSMAQELEAAEQRAEQLQAKLDAVAAIGPVHESWNADDDFKQGWDACREQVKQLLNGEVRDDG